MTDVAPGVAPQPLPDVTSEPFWNATASGQFELCRCVECRAWMHPPLERCRVCGGITGFEPVGLRGTVAGRIVMHRASVPGMGAVPYAIVLVDLDDASGVRLTGRITGTDPADVRVGQRVDGRIVDIPGGSFRQPEFSVEGTTP
jgi:uncharacterized protein